MHKNKKNAFTLVELIVVITILSILGTIAFISLQGYSTQARDSTRISDISSMKSSLELFHVDAGKYPNPSSGIDITYSGAIVWNQGTFGETVYANVNKLDKIPLDPLTDKEYTYSILNNKNEYELGGIVEGDIISMKNELIINTNAVTAEATAYTTGNYNGTMTKSLSGNICNVLSLPTIITNDTSVTDLQDIVTQKKFVYNGYKNLPSSFKSSKFKYDGGFDFTTNKLLAYTDNSSCTPLIDTTSYTARVLLISGLKEAYSGTIIENEGEIKNITNLDINESSPSLEVLNYGANFVNSNLGGKINISNKPISVNGTCGTDNGKDLVNTPTNLCTSGTSTGLIDNGIGNTFDWSCLGESGGTTQSCNSNHVNQWTSYTTVDGLTANAYNQSISQDSIGNIWVGNWGGGLSKFDGTNWTIFNTSDGLINDSVWSVVKDNSGNIWIGTNGGVSKFDGLSWTSYTTGNGLVNNYTNVVYKDSSGNLWFGTNGGVSKFDGLSWTSYTTGDGLVNNFIMAIGEDNSGNIWFGSLNSGLSKYDGISFTTVANWNSGLVNNSIRSIGKGVGNDIWIGTTNGLSKFDGTTWTTYTQANTSNLLAHDYINSIIKDNSGNMWIGCSSNGLSKFDGTNWTLYTTIDGLINNNIFSVYQDSNENYWFGTNGGVTRYIP